MEVDILFKNKEEIKEIAINGNYSQLKKLIISSLSFQDEYEKYFINLLRNKTLERKFKQVFKNMKNDLMKKDIMKILKFFINKMQKYQINNYNFNTLYTRFKLEPKNTFGTHNYQNFNKYSDREKNIKSETNTYEIKKNGKVNKKKNEIQKKNEVLKILCNFYDKYKEKIEGDQNFNKNFYSIINKNNFSSFFISVKNFWNKINENREFSSDKDKKLIFIQYFQLRLFAEKLEIENPKELEFIKREKTDKKYFVATYIEKKRRNLKRIDESWIPNVNYFSDINKEYWKDLAKYNLIMSLLYNFEKDQKIFSFLVGLLISKEEIFEILNDNSLLENFDEKLFEKNRKDTDIKFYAVFN